MPCPEGSSGCPCYGNGTCDSALECVDGACLDPGCVEGTEDCPCYANGTCNAELECTELQVCKPDASTGTGGDELCVPPAPAGWQGPFAAAGGGDGPPSCLAPFDGPERFASAGLNVPPAECACECGPVVVDRCELQYEFYTSSAASACAGEIINNGEGTVTTASGCSFVSDDASMCLRVVETTPVDAACAPEATEVLPALSWDESVALCSTVPTACGEGDLLFPPLSSQYDLGLCIFTEGDVSCPVGSPFAERLVYFEDTMDERLCEACTCDAPVDAECGGRVTLGTTIDCANGPAFNDVAPPQDEPINLSAVRIDYNEFPSDAEGEIAGTCAPAGGAAAGTATPVDPITVCCLP